MFAHPASLLVSSDDVGSRPPTSAHTEVGTPAPHKLRLNTMYSCCADDRMAAVILPAQSLLAQHQLCIKK